MTAVEIDPRDAAAGSLPGPHSPRWREYWTDDMLLAALRAVGVDPEGAKAMIRRYPEPRIKEQLRALPYHRQSISAAVTLTDAIRKRLRLPSWMRDEPVPRSDYRGPYASAKPWAQTQLDVGALLRKYGCDGVQWGVSERLRRASLLFERPIGSGAAARFLRVKIDLPIAADEVERNAAFRALYHYLKAKLEAATFRLSDGSMLVDLEREFEGYLLRDVAGAAAALPIAEGGAMPSLPSAPAESRRATRDHALADRPNEERRGCSKLTSR